MHLGAADWLARLAALGGDASGLRLSKAEARAVHDLATAARDGTAPFALGDALGPAGLDALRVRAALVGRPPDPGQMARPAGAPGPLSR